MGLVAGIKLGPYEILAPLGAGGMGEVYLARDTRLGRDVAVKVLPSRLCSDPNQRQRLEREARTISSLNHPNICQLHDVGCQDEIDFLVMEYVDGQTLAERLLSGPLPIKQALKIAIEIPISTPIYRRPILWATAAVVPEPRNESRTRSPRLVAS
jgi:serine/threonine protein kinase